MQKNKCYGKYIILGVFSLLILSCNMLPMSNTLTKTEEEKSFSTQANINTPELKTIPNFRFNEEDDAVEKKGTAYLSAGMIQNNPPVEELFVYNSADDYFSYAPHLYYFIDKREVKLSGSFNATFIEKIKYIDAGKIGKAWHTGEVTIAGTISGTPDKLKLDFSSSRLYKSTSLINFNGCDYTHTNVMRGGNFSGSAFLLGGNLYISGNLSGQGAVDAGGWCASHPSSQKPMSANFSMKSYVKEKPPVKVEVIANKEKTEFYKTNGKEKIRIEVTALNETRWRLEIKGYDDNNYPRTYYLDGSGNQDIDWDGKTNDALNPQDDVFFADSYSASKKMSTGYTTYAVLKPLEVKLTSADGMESKAKIKIDNTPPEIKIDKIEGNVIKGVINDVTEIDQASLPKEFTDGDKRISITYSNNPNPSNYRLDSNNTVNFKSLIFEAKVYGFDSTTDDIEDYKYAVGSKIEDETKDKLGNKAPKISFGLSMEQSDAEEEDNSSGFNTKGSPPNTVNKHTISEETFKALEKLSTYQGTADQIEKRLLNLNVPPTLSKSISRLSLSVKDLAFLPKVMTSFVKRFNGVYTIIDIGAEAISNTFKAQIECKDSLDNAPVNVEINGRSTENTKYINKNYYGVYRVNEPNSSLKAKNPLIIKTMFGIYDDYCKPIGMGIDDLSQVTVLDYNINIRNERFYNNAFESNPSISYKKPVSIAFNKTTYGTYVKNRKIVAVATIPWYASVRTKNQSILNNQIGAPFAYSGYYKVAVRFGECRNSSGKLVRRYGRGSNGFTLINRHEDYNKDFERFFNNPTGGIAYNVDSNDPKYSEFQLHVRERHDANFLNGLEFLKAYILARKNTVYISDTGHKLKENLFRKDKTAEDKKGTSFLIDYNVFIQYVKEIANMTDVNDYWIADRDHSLIIEGVRDGITIQVVFNKNGVIKTAYPVDGIHGKTINDENGNKYLDNSNQIIFDEYEQKLYYSNKGVISLVNIFNNSMLFAKNKSDENYLNKNFIKKFNDNAEKASDIKSGNLVPLIIPRGKPKTTNSMFNKISISDNLKFKN